MVLTSLSVNVYRQTNLQPVIINVRFHLTCQKHSYTAYDLIKPGELSKNRE
jgi:hypothetical protein